MGSQAIPPSRTRTCALAAAIVCLVAGAPRVGAGADMQDAPDFTIASWGLDDGLPSLRVWAIAEDQSGYLWLGTDDGLVRFDGVRFRRWTPVQGPPIQKGAVVKVFAARDGSIWLGQGPAGEGVSRVVNGRVENYGRAGLADAVITLLLQDHSGRTWAGNDDGLFELRENHWTRLAVEEGVPRAAVYGGFEDSRGTLWIGTSRGILRKDIADTRFELVDGDHRNVQGFTESADGAIWFTDPDEGFRALNRRGKPVVHIRAPGTQVLFDSRKGLWVATLDKGLWRVRLDDAAPAVTPVAAATRWPNDVLRMLHEDRNDNIWVAADSGLYRFTPRKATALTGYGRTRVIASTPDGSIWIGAAGGLVRVRGGSSTVYGAQHGLAGSGITGLATDRSGALWVATARRVARVAGERFINIDFGNQMSNIRFLGARSDGSLWLYDNEEGLFEWRDHRLARFEPPADLRERRVRCLYVDRDDRVWLSYTGGNVLVVTADRRSQLYPMPDEHTLINAIYQDRDGDIWLGGTQGLSRFENGRLITLAQARLPGYAVFSIADDAAHNLWLGGALGVVRISKGEFDLAVARLDYRPHFDMYDATDGIAGMPVWLGTPGAIESQGRIWFVTTGGVTIIDPGQEGVGSVVPRVQIDGVTANGRLLPLDTRVTLPPDVRNLSFEYTLPSLTSPMKVMFRHRLSNVDADWIDSGARRDVSYANLAPGTYTFDVAAISSDHGWNESAASWTFSIRPTFYQTAWFYALVAVALMLMSWLLWRLRVRQLRRQFSLVLAERARMSREIHDTLLQGMVGVALQFNMLSDLAGPSSPTLVNRLVQLRKQVEDYISETREAIFDLRVPSSNKDIVEVLRETGTRITDGTDVQFNVSVSGTVRPAGVSVDRQLVYVAREAIANAVRHARAHRVQVRVDYRSDSLMVRVSDDGQGFDVDRATRQSNGHYGLITMRERAQQVGGRVRIRSTVGMGTDVEVTVPLAGDL